MQTQQTNRLAKVLGCGLLGGVTLGCLVYYVAYHSLRIENVGGMGGIGHAWDCMLLGVGGAAVGMLVGGYAGYRASLPKAP